MSSRSGKNKKPLAGKLNWGKTWAAMKILSRSLHYRLKGHGAAWLQQVGLPGTTVLNRSSFILDQVVGKKVLHVGFTDHPFTRERVNDRTLLHLQLKQKAAQLTGLDNDEASVQLYKELTGDENVCTGDIGTAYPQMATAAQPDFILLTEVLEHLRDPHTAVSVLHQSFPAGTQVLVTVPNYLALDNIAAGLHHAESVHPDHYWHFSPYTLRRLFDDRQFKLETFHFGMYYQPGVAVNAMLRRYPFYGDCIMAVFTILKPAEHA